VTVVNLKSRTICRPAAPVLTARDRAKLEPAQSGSERDLFKSLDDDDENRVTAQEGAGQHQEDFWLIQPTDRYAMDLLENIRIAHEKINAGYIELGVTKRIGIGNLSLKDFCAYLIRIEKINKLGYFFKFKPFFFEKTQFENSIFLQQ
jgi:hypothetical protein